MPARNASSTRANFWGGAAAAVVIVVLIYANLRRLPLPNVTPHSVPVIPYGSGVLARVPIGWPLAFAEADFRAELGYGIGPWSYSIGRNLLWWCVMVNAAVALWMSAATFICIRRVCHCAHITVTLRGYFVALAVCATCLALARDDVAAYWRVGDAIAVSIILVAISASWLSIFDLSGAAIHRISAVFNSSCDV